MIKYTSGRGHWDFWFCSFSYFLDRFFSFLVLVFFAVCFHFLAFWFLVFTKNTNGFSDLISNAVFSFSYLAYLGSSFS